MNSLFQNLFLMQTTAAPSTGTSAAPAAAAATGGNPTMDFLMNMLPIVGIIVVFYFLIIRPQNKKQKEMQKMINTLEKGDKVITIGGVHGTVYAVKEATVVVKVDDESRIEFSKSAISSVSRPGMEAVPPAPAK